MKASIVLSLLWITLSLVACGPSEAELNATATAEMISLAATQTAGAPTATPDPTATPLPTPTPAPSPTPTLDPTPTPPPAEALLEAAFDALETTGSYRLIMNGAMTTGYLGITMEADTVSDFVYQPPDRAQGVTTTNMAGETEESEQIIIGETAYVKDPATDEWRVDLEMLAGFDFEAVNALSQDVEDLVFLGEETLGGHPVYHLQAAKTEVEELFDTLFSAGPVAELIQQGGSFDVEADFLINYWIGVEDGRFVKNTVEGEMAITISGPTGSDEPIEMSFLIDNEALFSEYDKTVQIEAPKVASPTLLSSPYGTMIRYEDKAFPFSIGVPAGWQEQSAESGETARFANEAGDLFIITVEDMAAQLLGEWTLEAYTDLVVESFPSNIVEVLSREPRTTQQDEPAEILTFTILDGQFKGQRFVYMLEDRIAFNATYVVDADRFDESDPLIAYSFGTFWSGEIPETVSIWHGWGGSYYDEIEAVLTEYETAHGLWIEPFLIYYDGQVQVDLNTAVATGTGPDILAWWVSGAMEGNIVPITPWVNEEYQFANFEPAAVDATIWQGDVWSIPLSQEGIAIVYNKDLVSADDLPHDPGDFDGLLEAAVAFREDNPDKYLLCNQGIGLDSHDTYHVAPIYFGFGGDDELGFIDGEGNVHVDTPERLAAAEWLLEFAEVAPEITSHTICLEGFIDGTFAAWWTGPWAIADLEAAGIDYGILPFGRPFMSIQRLMMGTNAVDRSHEEMVVDILKHLGDPDIQARMALANGTVPANSEALEMLEDQGIYSIAAFGEAIRTGIPIGNSAYPDAQWDPIADMTRNIIGGDQTPEEALAETQAELERIIEGFD